MQPWVRKVNQSIASLQQVDRNLANRLDLLRGAESRYNADVTAITASTGVNATWQRLLTNPGPTLVVNCTTGLLKVTMGARLVGTRTVTASEQAGFIAMTVSVDNMFDTDTDLAEESNLGLQLGVHAPASSLASYSPRVAASRERLLQIPIGVHTIRMEYLYYNLTAGLQPFWSHRTLSAQSI